MAWPPTEKTVLELASAAMNSDTFVNSSEHEMTVLCYLDGWGENENGRKILIFDPIHFANTRFVRCTYAHPTNGRQLKLIVGEKD